MFFTPQIPAAMGFLGVYKAIYDYVPQAEGELAINDGDVLYILEKNSEDDWWKAKKKASADDEDEPEGLIPNNYVETVVAIPLAVAIPSRFIPNATTGKSRSKSSCTVRIHASDRRRAFFPGRCRYRRLRHLGS